MLNAKLPKNQISFFIGLVISILFFLLPMPVQGVETIIVKTEALNVRSGPAITYDCIGQVTSGQQLTVEEEQDGWYKIRAVNNTTGWVIKDYVALEPQDLVITGSVVNVRTGPGTDFSKITSLAQGTKVTAIDFQKDWYQIKYPDGTGWVARWLVQTTENAEVIPVDEEKQPLSESEDNQPPDTPLKPESIQGISWNWEKTATGVKIAIQGAEPLGYIEKIYGGEPIIALEFGGTWQSPLGSEEINYGGIEKINTGKGSAGTLFQVDLAEEMPYETTLSNDGCLLNLNIACVKEEKSNVKTVVIDPGHGSNSERGYDPGAIGPSGLYESDVVLDIGNRVEELLIEKGIRVIMTRDGKANLTLEDRADIANELSADAFVSIHANSSVSKTVNGTTTYYYAPLGTNLGMQREERQYLAQTIQKKMLEVLERNNLGVREENFAVLRCTTVPSVLVETAFISNPEEEKLLADDQFRGEAARAIAEGIWEFLQRE
ncbi:MAG: N-acetylmuramoyl-L-alanine amidase [Dehalobacterium sp.]